MIAHDSNVLMRFLANEDPGQGALSQDEMRWSSTGVRGYVDRWVVVEAADRVRRATFDLEAARLPGEWFVR